MSIVQVFQKRNTCEESVPSATIEAKQTIAQCHRASIAIKGSQIQMTITSMDVAPAKNSLERPEERVVIYNKQSGNNSFVVQVVDDDDENDEDEEEDSRLSAVTRLTGGGEMSITRAANLTANRDQVVGDCPAPQFVEKSVIIHKDENGFGLRFKGYSPVFVEHVHENGAAWRAGVRQFDTINKVNGIPVSLLSHKDVILMFKSCSKFVALTLLSSTRVDPSAQPQYLVPEIPRQTDVDGQQQRQQQQVGRRSSCTLEVRNQRQASVYSQRSGFMKSSSGDLIEARDSFRINRTHVPSGRLNSSLLLTTESITGRGGSQSDLARAGRDKTDSSATSKVGRRASNDSIENEKLARDKRLAVGANEPTVEDDTCSNYIPRNDDTSAARCQQLRSSMRSNQSAASSLPAETARGLVRPDSGSPDNLTRQNCRNQIESSAISSNDKKRLILKLSQSNSTNSLPTETALKTAARPIGGQVPSAVPLNQQAAVQPKPPVAVNKRLEIIKEFIDTERTHTERLRCLDELFYRPLKADGLMTHEQLRAVFSCHRTLYRIHRQIYRILLSANCFKMYSEPLIGSALLEIFEGQLKRRLERAACSFCTAQATNVELLNKLTRRDTKTGEFLAHVTSQQMVGRLGIKDLLASCFQRLTKYPLLLESLLRATPQVPSDEQLIEQHDSDARAAAAAVDSARAGLDHDENNSDDERDGAAPPPAQSLNSKRMFAISLAEEREFVERALKESREILVRVNEAIKVATSRQKLKEIWKRTDKHPGVPLIDITKQQVVHEGSLTLRLSKRSFDVYVLLLNDYLIILTREGQDKYRLKFFTPEGKAPSSLNSASSLASTAAGLSAANQLHHHHHHGAAVYSPVFVIDEHLTTRDAATDENGFYLLCKRKDDSRIYEFASRSPAERMKWRDKIQWTIDRQMSRHLMSDAGGDGAGASGNRRASCASTLTKSSSDISSQNNRDDNDLDLFNPNENNGQFSNHDNDRAKLFSQKHSEANKVGAAGGSNEPTKFVGTISYVDKDEIVLPSEMETFSANVNKAIQMNISD